MRKIPTISDQVNHMLVALAITGVYILICAVHSIDIRAV